MIDLIFFSLYLFNILSTSISHKDYLCFVSSLFIVIYILYSHHDYETSCVLCFFFFFMFIVLYIIHFIYTSDGWF